MLWNNNLVPYFTKNITDFQHNGSVEKRIKFVDSLWIHHVKIQAICIINHTTRISFNFASNQTNYDNPDVNFASIASCCYVTQAKIQRKNNKEKL